MKSTAITALFLTIVAVSVLAEPAIRVPAGTDLTELGIRPISEIDYGSFRWVTLSTDDYARLVASGRSVDLFPDAGEVRVGGYRFDPLNEGEPVLAPELTASDAGLRLRLVQLVGPVRDPWVAAIEGVGARIIQYYPHHTYLIWSDPSSVAKLRNFSFVRWVGLFHPAYKLGSNLQGRTGMLRNVAALVYSEGHPETGVGGIEASGASVLRVSKAQGDGRMHIVEATATATSLGEMARLDTVIWIGFQSPQRYSEDEMSDQIVAGNHPGGSPVTGYGAQLSALGVDGTGVIWAIADTGVDWDHPDLGSHIVGGYSALDSSCIVNGQPGSDCPSGGHGTHVAGIAFGDATGGFTDGDGFLYGLGMAPATSIFAMNVFANSVTLEDTVRIPLLGGAVGANNSWAWSSGSGHGYTLACRTEDVLVRDGNLDTPTVAEPFLQIFSAGNSGPGAMTITEPKEAKNIVSVANSFNFRQGNIDTISTGSSRGPAIDGRTLPVVAAPGSLIASTRNDTGGSCSSPIGGTNNLYSFCSGTSMASPHVAGASALIVEWWRGFNAGANPSMAMVKALLVNGAVDMATADIPNNNEGWGRVNITQVIATTAQTHYLDQTELLVDTGTEWTATFLLVDPGQPLKVTLTYSDAPGAAEADPALVNDLDLQVVNGGQTYLGNVFSGGWSMTGGTADPLNNLENVYLAAPVAGTVVITITASNLPGDGVPYNGDSTDQDWALVCSNCLSAAVFSDGFESGGVSAWSHSSP